MHHKQINFGPSTVFDYSAACLSVIFELLPGLTPIALLRHAGCILSKSINLDMHYSFLTTMYERDIRIHTVVTSENVLRKNVNNIFLPEIHAFG